MRGQYYNTQMKQTSENSKQKKVSKRKILFSATLDSININLRYQYNQSHPPVQQKPTAKTVKHGNITVTFQEDSEKSDLNQSVEIKNVSNISNKTPDILLLKQNQDHNLNQEKNIQNNQPNQQKIFKNQSQFPHTIVDNNNVPKITLKQRSSIISYVPEKNKLNLSQKHNLRYKNKNKKSLKKKEKNGDNQIFQQDDQSNEFLIDQDNQLFKRDNKTHKKQQQQQGNQYLSKIQQDQQEIDIIKHPTSLQPLKEQQDVQQKKQRKKIKKEKGSTKKLDLRLLKEFQVMRSDGQDSYKPQSESEQMRLRTFRNRRIGQYIKRALRSATESGKSSSIKELLISVLKNYENQLQCIRDQQKRVKRFQCLRRRIYECLSVLSAVGLIDKRKKIVNGTKQICQQTQKSRQIKIQYRESIRKIQQRINFKKQKYFDAVTRNRIIKTLIQRNSQSDLSQNEKIYLPFKLIVGHRPNMLLKAQRENRNDKFINKITILSKKFIKPIHSLDAFIMLRRIVQPLKQLECIEELTSQYMQSINKQDKYEQIKKIREDLISKMRYRNMVKPGQKKKIKLQSQRNKQGRSPKQKVKERLKVKKVDNV